MNKVELKQVATQMATNMRGSLTWAMVVKILATFPKSCNPRVTGESSPVPFRRQLSKIWGTLARFKIGIEQT